MKVILTKVKEKFEKFVKRLLHQPQVTYKTFSVKKVETARQQNFMSEYAVSQLEYDAFRMKAIVLLKNKDASIASSLQSLIKDPVQVKVGPRENEKVVVQLSQRFECSGRVFLVEGEFLRDSTKKIQSIPLSHSFKITSQSKIQ